MITVITPVATEPLTLANAKAHLRVDVTDDDTLITSLITVAREEAEHLTGQSLATQTLQLRASTFDDLVLQRGPVQSVSWVKYQDASNAQQTLSGSVYYLDSSGAEPVIRLAYGQSWPTIYEQEGGVLVQYVAGFTDCPLPVIQWMKLRIGTLYEVRESASERPAIDMHWVDRLLDRHRVWKA